jgi:hypothetical protein
MLTNFIIACTALLYIHIKSYTSPHVSIFEITNEKMRQIPKKRTSQSKNSPYREQQDKYGQQSFHKTSIINSYGKYKYYIIFKKIFITFFNKRNRYISLIFFRA